MASVGAKLKKAREKKRLSLDEVSQKTRIHPKVLEAMEEDRAEQRLSKAYLKGFLKSYAHLVGLDGEELVREYLEGSPAATLPSLPAAFDTFFSLEEERGVSPWVKRSLTLIFLIGAILLIGVGVSKIRFSESKPSLRGTALSRPLRIPESETLKLKLRAKENTWVAITSDGHLVYQGLLEKGKEETWGGQRRLGISLSDGGGVSLELNRKSLGVPGEKGRPIEKLVITHEGWGVEKDE
ncbi:MAG: DUF4115 domain-containing protein [Candidatus Omnitrophica bacterium]|nr:DUF4115 domain-containing protein [Candidatus Omnitrophota bacterium]